MTVLKDRARGDRQLVSALATATAGTSHRPRRLSCASRTYPSPGPAQRAQVRRASLLPAEASFQFQQGPRIVLAHVEKHYILGLVASSKYPSATLSLSDDGQTLATVKQKAVSIFYVLPASGGCTPTINL